MRRRDYALSTDVTHSGYCDYLFRKIPANALVVNGRENVDSLTCSIKNEHHW